MPVPEKSYGFLPAAAAANKARPMARGPMTPNDGSPTATE